MENMFNYKPCDLYDHSIILIRSKTSQGEVSIDDLMNQEIVFNNNDFKLYIKTPTGDELVKFGYLDDSNVTINSVWSSFKQKKETIKYSLIF